jgi:hypothetical protein
MPRMPPHAAKISDVIIFSSKFVCTNFFFFYCKFKALKTFKFLNHFHTMFKALKLFSLYLLKIAYCIFVAKIMATYISTKVCVSKSFQHSGKISLSKIIEPQPNSNLNCLFVRCIYIIFKVKGT